MFKITREWLEEFKTSRGGYKHAQIAAIGGSNPPKKGWRKKAIGKLITLEAKKAFEDAAGTGMSRKKQRELCREVRKQSYEESHTRGRRSAPDEQTPQKTYFAYRIPDPEFAKSDAFLETYEWRRLRMEVLRKYGAKCQCCGATPEDGVKINVDHIKPRRTHPHLCLDINNLQVLCNPCNHGKGNWDRTDWRPLDDKIEAEYSAEAVSAALRRISGK